MTAPASDRLDKWLWYARFVKTRGLAQKLIERGQVLINGAPVTKTSAVVHTGDTLAVTFGPLQRRVVVRGVSERRGPAEEARALYDEPEAASRLAPEDAALPLYLSVPKNQR